MTFRNKRTSNSSFMKKNKKRRTSGSSSLIFQKSLNQKSLWIQVFELLPKKPSGSHENIKQRINNLGQVFQPDSLDSLEPQLNVKPGFVIAPILWPPQGSLGDWQKLPIYQMVTHHEVLWMPRVQCTWGFWVSAT